MKKLLSMFALLLAMSAGTASAAQHPLVWCNGCTAAQKSEKAKTGSGPITYQVVVVYVGDLNTRTVNAYRIYKTIVSYNETGQPVWSPKQSVPETAQAEQVDAANRLMDFYYTFPVGWQKPQFVRAKSGSRDVYDIVNRGTSQTQFLNELRNDSSVLPAPILNTGMRVAAALRLVDMNPLAALVFDYRFTDGSTIELEYDVTTNKFKVVDNSGVDKDSNPVLSTPSDRPVIFQLETSDSETFRNWSNQMTLLGYTGITVPRVSYACVVAGGTRTCYIVNQ